MRFAASATRSAAFTQASVQVKPGAAALHFRRLPGRAIQPRALPAVFAVAQSSSQPEVDSPGLESVLKRMNKLKAKLALGTTLVSDHMPCTKCRNCMALQTAVEGPPADLEQEVDTVLDARRLSSTEGDVGSADGDGTVPWTSFDALRLKMGQQLVTMTWSSVKVSDATDCTRALRRRKLFSAKPEMAVDCFQARCKTRHGCPGPGMPEHLLQQSIAAVVPGLGSVTLPAVQLSSAVMSTTAQRF